MIVGGTGYFLRWLLYHNRSSVTPEDALPSDLALRLQLEAEINAFLRDSPGTKFEAWENLCGPLCWPTLMRTLFCF